MIWLSGTERGYANKGKKRFDFSFWDLWGVTERKSEHCIGLPDQIQIIRLRRMLKQIVKVESYLTSMISIEICKEKDFCLEAKFVLLVPLQY